MRRLLHHPRILAAVLLFAAIGGAYTLLLDNSRNFEATYEKIQVGWTAEEVEAALSR